MTRFADRFADRFAARFAASFALVALLAARPVLAQVQIGEFSGGTPSARYGEGLSCRGDRLLVGAPFAGDQSQNGAVQLLTPGDSSTPPKDFPVNFDTSNLRYGDSVAIAEDFTGDGVPDYLVAGPRLASSAGFVTMSSDPGPGPIDEPIGFFDAASVLEQFGEEIAPLRSSAGPRVAVAAPAALPVPAVRIFSLELPASSTPIATVVTTPQTGSLFGSTMAPVDIDRDGNDEILISSPGFFGSTGGGTVGQVSVANQSGVILFALTGTSTEFLLGTSVSDAGDLNDDGFQDIVIGGIKQGTGPSPSGRVGVLDGQALLRGEETPLCLVQGPTYTNLFGRAVAGVGDVTGDGIPDFAVGDPNSGEGRGAVFIFSLINGQCVEQAALPGSTPGYALGSRLVGSARPLNEGGCDFTSDGTADFAATGDSSLGEEFGSVVVYAGLTPVPTPTPSPTPTPAAELPLRARLSFRLTETGNFTARVAYDFPSLTTGARRSGAIPQPAAHQRTAAASQCTATLYGRIVKGGRVGPLEQLASRSLEGTGVTFKTSGLPRVRVENCIRPEAHLLVATNCGGTILKSNVIARYMNCGLGKGVEADFWLNAVETGLNSTPAALTRHQRRWKRAASRGARSSHAACAWKRR